MKIAHASKFPKIYDITTLLMLSSLAQVLIKKKQIGGYFNDSKRQELSHLKIFENTT